MDIAAFFGICVWFVPLFLFLSLSANDNALPSLRESPFGEARLESKLIISRSIRSSITINGKHISRPVVASGCRYAEIPILVPFFNFVGQIHPQPRNQSPPPCRWRWETSSPGRPHCTTNSSQGLTPPHARIDAQLLFPLGRRRLVKLCLWIRIDTNTATSGSNTIIVRQRASKDTTSTKKSTK